MTTTATTPNSTRYTPLCPDWCTLNDARHENTVFVVGGKPVADHQGPTFGPFFISAQEWLLSGTPLESYAHADLSDGESQNSADLRELAAHALAAADFLESQASD